MGGEVKEKTGEKCPICSEETSRIGKPEEPKSEVCINCGVLETLSVRVPAAIINFLKAYYVGFCGYSGDARRHLAGELSRDSASIVRDLVDDHMEDRYTIIANHDLREIFEKTDPIWMEAVDKDVDP